jgi:hypothetical protein
MFPMACRNGDLTAQEKALEFMLFDLSACVSPDSWTPPVPSTQYNPVTFSLDFKADCAADMLPVWREFQWQAVIPSSANITFTAATAEDTTGLATATAVPLATAENDTVLPNWDTAFIDTTNGAFYHVEPTVGSLRSLRIGVTLNPTTDRKGSPILSSWQVAYDCLDAI